MTKFWAAFARDESGQGLVEYIVIIAVVAIGFLAVLYGLRGKIKAPFSKASDTLAAQPGSTEAP